MLLISLHLKNNKQNIKPKKSGAPVVVVTIVTVVKIMIVAVVVIVMVLTAVVIASDQDGDCT
jgi:flagellar basal body-associated protein FliL